ncbi:hypothetical protein NC651_016140 [Populus alba x Populus x berolinensis]|nr:hypothetical protein NC651_016140 [Populus alba x Populus x berolinensis]
MAMVAAAKMMIGILCKGFEFHFNGIDEIIHVIPSDYQQPAKQEFMLDTHLIKASCEDCSAACGHFRLLDWALANQLILDWAYCEDYSFASNLINLNCFFFFWVLLFSI